MNEQLSLTAFLSQLSRILARASEEAANLEGYKANGDALLVTQAEHLILWAFDDARWNWIADQVKGHVLGVDPSRLYHSADKELTHG